MIYLKENKKKKKLFSLEFQQEDPENHVFTVDNLQMLGCGQGLEGTRRG